MKTAVLLVHGIGNQEPGETLSAFVKAFRAAVPSADVSDGNPAVLEWQGRTIQFHEVYWADILRGAKTQGSFDTLAPSIVAWFPLLNLLRGVYDRKRYPVWLALWWTLILAPLGLLSIFLYFGAGLALRVMDRDRKPPTAAESMERLKHLGRESERPRERSRLDDILDEFAGDVLNYVYSTGGVLPKDSPLAGSAKEIVDRFDEALAKASQECDEIQIVSHSLGTVVMYHGLARLSWNEDPLRRVRKIYTLGSPLEKIGFLWPELMALPADAARNPALEWHNVCDRLDLVAGRLKRFDAWTPVKNHRVWGMGGAARAHVSYQRSPVFQDLITEGLLGTASHGQVAKARNAVLSSGETLLVPLVVGLLALLGLALIILTGALIPYLVSLAVRLFSESLAVEVRAWGTWIFVGGILFVFWLNGLIRAVELHGQILAARRRQT